MALVSVESSGAVRTVTLNRPEKRNALNAEMLRELAAAFSAPATDERVVVLRSTGTVFCAGLDLRERARTLDVPGASPIEEVLHLVETFPLPVVAVVQGDAIAGGCELSLHCDFVVASTVASFGMSLAQIGLAPTWFLAKKLLEVAGPVAAREVLFLGNPLRAERMYDLGIIARAVPPEALEHTASVLVERLAANAPLSLRAMKALLLREMQFREDIPHDDIDAMIEAARRSSDAKEGIAARMAGRTAAFTGR